ncbi:YbgA family protein [Tindallia californiensis]|uniref:Uncharacterized conserved protein YbgA, DUF1722 family n=1 Tax=Tindallia californiensis TaxID=159292 RepID=A0A1H3KCG8_9FIRM|nr:DUF523 and DUF1722 domain-containing protein [Tindallia californiensis]SDY49629.1 Uncharacterized conserved protein YbgA, DUF1722 family [Tindallia californiensis]
MSKINVGVSTCLLGESVRYDGGHKLDRYVRDVLGEYFEYYPVCPEQESGMPTPREAMRLVGDEENHRLLTNKTGVDKTPMMKSYIDKKLPMLEKKELHGFIFKKDSPSSGLYRVKIYHENGNPIGKGSGMFAAAYKKAFPNIPAEEDGRLNDPHLRENFIVRVFAHHRWKEFLKKDPSVGELVEYHTREKMLMMAHSVEHYKTLGKITALGSTIPKEELFAKFEKEYLEGLTFHATVKKNTNVLHHILGYFKKELSPWEKQEVLELVERYHRREVPLVVPLTLLNHFIRKYEKEYLIKQRYLNPHPSELMLRNFG